MSWKSFQASTFATLRRDSGWTDAEYDAFLQMPCEETVDDHWLFPETPQQWKLFRQYRDAAKYCIRHFTDQGILLDFPLAQFTGKGKGKGKAAEDFSQKGKGKGQKGSKGKGKEKKGKGKGKEEQPPLMEPKAKGKVAPPNLYKEEKPCKEEPRPRDQQEEVPPATSEPSGPSKVTADASEKENAKDQLKELRIRREAVMFDISKKCIAQAEQVEQLGKGYCSPERMLQLLALQKDLEELQGAQIKIDDLIEKYALTDPDVEGETKKDPTGETDDDEGKPGDDEKEPTKDTATMIVEEGETNESTDIIGYSFNVTGSSVAAIVDTGASSSIMNINTANSLLEKGQMLNIRSRARTFVTASSGKLQSTTEADFLIHNEALSFAIVTAGDGWEKAPNLVGQSDIKRLGLSVPVDEPARLGAIELSEGPSGHLILNL